MPYDQINKDFLREVLKGKKKLLKMKEVNFCNVPSYDEIGVKALYEKVVKLPGMPHYFPDKMPVGKQCCKSYFYNIWNTIYPDDVQAVINHANANRHAISSQRVKDETIVLTEQWQDELNSLPFVSK